MTRSGSTRPTGTGARPWCSRDSWRESASATPAAPAAPHVLSGGRAGARLPPEGRPADRALAPHGISVIVDAPAVFRRMGAACPERHLGAAPALGVGVRGLAPERAGEKLAGRVVGMMARTGMPGGLRGVGYDETDIDALTERARPQQRLIDNAPRAIARPDLAALFRESLDLWRGKAAATRPVAPAVAARE